MTDARTTLMTEAMSTYREHAVMAETALKCSTGDCTSDPDDEHEHTGEELAEANTHAVLASAAAAMFQGLAALEAADRMSR
jgi:hypothetical protein